MSDDFYRRQAAGDPSKKTKKGTRKLKKDWITDINDVLGDEILGLDKCTVVTLQQLLGAIKNACN